MKNPFEAYGLHIAGITHLSPKEALELAGNGAVIVDVRNDKEMNGKKFIVPEVIYLPAHTLADEYEKLPKDKPLIFADSVGLKSKEAVLFLMAKGFTLIANLNGGIVDWQGDGLPTDINDDEVLSGGCACQLRPKKVYRPKSGC